MNDHDAGSSKFVPTRYWGFWDAVMADGESKLPEGVDEKDSKAFVLRLDNAARFPGTWHNALYIRESFGHLYSLMLDHFSKKGTVFILTGSAGAAKLSFFSIHHDACFRASFDNCLQISHMWSLKSSKPKTWRSSDGHWQTLVCNRCQAQSIFQELIQGWVQIIVDLQEQARQLGATT